MPRGDRTGPMGLGAMSGRGVGWCRGADAPGSAAFGYGGGRGWGMGYKRQRGFGGRGGGGGWCNGFFATGRPGPMRSGGSPASGPVSPEAEKRVLEQQAGALQSELDQIRRRLSDIGGESAPLQPST